MRIETSESTPLPAGQPWNPLQISGLMFWITTIGAGIALGINWRRLGKPQWTLPTILLSIVILVGVLGIIFGGMNMLSGTTRQIRLSLELTIALIMGLAGLNFGFIAAVAYLQ